MSQENRRAREEKKKEERDDVHHAKSKCTPLWWPNARSRFARSFQFSCLDTSCKLQTVSCPLSVGFHTLYLALVSFDLWPEIYCHVLISNFRVWCQGDSYSMTWWQPGQEPGAGPGQRPQPKMEECSEIWGGAGWSSRERKKTIKNEEKGHKKGLQLGNWWNLTQKQKRVF